MALLHNKMKILSNPCFQKSKRTFLCFNITGFEFFAPDKSRIKIKMNLEQTIRCVHISSDTTMY